MSKNDEIFKLFSKNFKTNNFQIQRSIAADSFCCKHEKECKVKKTEEPIWSPSVGNKDTPIMIVAEAPSGEGGEGPHIGGLFELRERSKKSPLYILRQFVKENWGTIPYFTNLVKCGVAKQQHKEVLNTRATHCFEYFLAREIKIIQPKIILCIGSLSYSSLKKYQLHNEIDRSIRLIPLMHYSRQAQLPLSPSDKAKIIWKWQADISRAQIGEMPLSELSYFKKQRGRRDCV